MNIPDKNCRYQPPPHRRKTPSFSSSLLDSILRSIDETNSGGFHDDDVGNLHSQVHDYDHDHDLRFFASEPKRSSKINFTHNAHFINGDEQVPSLRRAIMIDQWIETHNNNNRNSNSNIKVKKFSSDSSSSGTTAFTTTSTSSETETPSTYRSLPNSFTISREEISQKSKSKFMKSTKLKAMKIYGDLKKVKQPMSPGSRISAFILSLFASSSSKKAKIEESINNFRSLKKSRSIKHDPSSTMTCTSFSRSCMSKKQKQHTSSNVNVNVNVKRSVRFYPENDTVFVDRKSTNERDSDSMRWFTEKNYTKNYKKFMVNVEDDDEDDEDDLFELEIVGGVGIGSCRQELPVFETTDLRKIRI
ncbi:hypothetical protein QVD17_26548 [Tagetes erecta]|uniref:Protein BIG GRAIN 1-like B n=1 Tax=Tagetes erecta TaxID=13708 RepID=A0AAD8NQX7_TARER|nr:hypothetical protein QVD17_26548 [Tagetes erecta]